MRIGTATFQRIVSHFNQALTNLSQHEKATHFFHFRRIFYCIQPDFPILQGYRQTLAAHPRFGSTLSIRWQCQRREIGQRWKPFEWQWVEDRKGQKVSAVYFNGDNSIIVVPHSGAINFDKSQDYAISCWLKYGAQIDTKAIDNYMLSKWWPAGFYPFALWGINQTHSQIIARGVITSGRWDGGCNTNDPFTAVGFERQTNDDRWHHFVVVKQGTIMQSYLDGALMSTVPENTFCTTQNTSDFCIGMNYPGDTAAWSKGGRTFTCCTLDCIDFQSPLISSTLHNHCQYFGRKSISCDQDPAEKTLFAPRA
ncbi:MAG: hypothetical protein JNN28_09640 [Saprospiraceae bacterium]|nr:hypothetical protein [Saprospiraceae bacterium]